MGIYKHKSHQGFQGGSKNYSWKGGLPKCIDCGEQLKTYKAKRCLICSGKQHSKDMTGRKLSKNIKRKLVLLMKDIKLLRKQEIK